MAWRLSSAFVVAAALRRSGVEAIAFAIALGALSGCGKVPSDQVRREKLDYAQKLHLEANWLLKQGDAAQAFEPARRALEIRQQILGENDADYAASLNTLAEVYEWMCDYNESERLFLRALSVRKKVLGDNHLDYAQTADNLGRLYQAMGDYAAAEPLLLQACDVRKAFHSEDNVDYAKSLNNLGLLYHVKGDYKAAEPLLAAACDLMKRIVGEDSQYATCENNLALLYMSMGEFDKAERLLLEARELTEKALGTENNIHAVRLSNLAMLYQSTGEFDKALPLILEARDVIARVLGEKHPYYPAILNNLALLYESMGDSANARQCYVSARESRKKVVGEEHPDYAVSLFNLAQHYLSAREFEMAERLFLQARDLTKRVLAEEHPLYANILCNLAALNAEKGDYDTSDLLFRHGLEESRKLLDETASVQSEQEQLKFANSLRHRLDQYISLALASKRFGRTVFDEVLDWKGATMVRQWRLRQVAGEADVAETFATLQATTRRLSALLRMVVHPQQQATWQRQIDELSERKDGLEAQLVQKSDRYREAKRRIRLQDLLAVLPEDLALVDLLEFLFVAPSAEQTGKRVPQRRFVAFVVRHGQPVQPIDLGPAEAIDRAVTDWRQTFGESKESIAAGEFLRKQVWERLEPRLQGVRQVLISPDKALGRIPFYALPGRQPDSYLIDEYLIASMPVPQLLPLLLQRSDGKQPQGELLLVGDVDYSADPQGPEPLNAGHRQQQPIADLSFPPLPATAKEVDSIADLYKNSHLDLQDSVRTLRRAKVTESTLLREAPGFRMLHLPTHGYFADTTKVSALGTTRRDSELMLARLFGQSQAVSHVRGYHPGMLSGLALTGANRTPQPNQDDGILTAQEIAFMPLDGVELVVLSACETGLGPTAGGEGLLGVQRAFQVAGARTTVASLWKVDDQATAALMRLFYYKLWNEHKPPVEALRESQLALYRQPHQIEGLAITRGPKFGEVVKIVERNQDQPVQLDSSSGERRAPIGQWAAFVLSGDWR